MVHLEIKPIKAFVHELVLYDMDPTYKDMIPCTIFGISSYLGEALTFSILLNDGSLFSYVPPHLISLTKEKNPFSLKECVYHNSPDINIAVKEYSYLISQKTYVFIKERNEWFKSKYIFTIDWYRGNDLLHLLFIEDKFPVFLPSHKIKFKEDLNFKSYKKVHNEWII